MPSTADRVQRGLVPYYASRFPHRHHIRIAHLQDITSGWESEVISFDLAYMEDGQERHESLVLRLYPGIGAAEKATREFAFMQRLHHAGYPLPKPALLEASASPFGGPFLIMDRVAGRPLSALLDEAPEPRRQGLLALFCQLLARLHALDWRSLVADPARYSAETALEEQLAATGAELARVSRPEYERVLAWLWQRCAQVQPRRLAVTHGDFHPANILVSEEGQATVIDWSGVGIADYRADLAWALLLVSTYGEPELWERVLRLYERYSGHRVEQIEYFEVAAMLRRLIAASVSAGGRAEELGLRPATRNRVRQDVDNVRQVYGLLVAHTGLAIPQVEELIASLAAAPA